MQIIRYLQLFALVKSESNSNINYLVKNRVEREQVMYLCMMPISCFNFWSQTEYCESMILQYHIAYLSPNCLRMQRQLIIQCLRCLLNRPIYGLLLLLDPLLNLCLVKNLPRIGLLGCRPAVVEGVSDKSGGPDTDNTTESCDSPIPLG